MKKLYFVLGLVSTLAINDQALASPCRQEALEFMRTYGLSETSGQGPLASGTASGTAAIDPKLGRISDSQQLSPLQQAKIQPEVRQAIQADESGDVASCQVKMAHVKSQLKQAK
ncbi:MAG: hypothetical protein ACRYG8_14005 [Janthinobacterium lividum]